ncbi:PQQ-binding-like beta-propeller repeat protein, partial [bacterium]
MKNRKLLICLAITLALAVVVVVAGTFEWGMFRQGPQRRGATDSPLRPPISIKWTFEAEGPIYSSPVVSAGLIYIGSRDNRIYAIDIKTGLKKWSYETGGWVDSTPLVYKGKVFVPSRDGGMYALNALNGQPAWKENVGGTHCSSPIVHDNKVIFGAGSPGKFVVALDIDTGKEVWRYETTQMVYSSPAIFNNT